MAPSKSSAQATRPAYSIIGVETLNEAGIQAKQIAIVDYDREQGYAPAVHPRRNEVYVLVPTDRLEEALNLLKGLSK